VEEELASFEPEAGAYTGSHAAGGHSHGHGGHSPLAPVPLRQKIHRPADVDGA
ncbi:urease accessory protein UreE, partial [Microbacterium sp. AISO3]